MNIFSGIYIYIIFFPMARQHLGGLGLLIFRGFTITHFRHTTFGRTPLDEWSARRSDLYLPTHNTNKRQTFMPPAGFEPTIPVSERPKTHVLDRAATGIGGIIMQCPLSTTHLILFQIRTSFRSKLFAIKGKNADGLFEDRQLQGICGVEMWEVTEGAQNSTLHSFMTPSDQHILSRS
jgi:hypothetical protein